MDRFTFHCAAPGCPVVVTGIYCGRHRDEREAERRARAAERSERLKQLWTVNREGMLAAIRAGRAPATEGK